MKLVWFERDKGFVSYASKYLVVFLADIDVTRALSTLSTVKRPAKHGSCVLWQLASFMT